MSTAFVEVAIVGVTGGVGRTLVSQLYAQVRRRLLTLLLTAMLHFKADHAQHGRHHGWLPEALLLASHL